MTPEQRSRVGRIGIYTRLATEDRHQMTAAACATATTRFEKQVDPDGVLDPAERATRAEYAKKAYFTALAAKSAKVRADRKAAALKRKAA